MQKISTVESLQSKRMTDLKNARENSQTFADGKNYFNSNFVMNYLLRCFTVSVLESPLYSQIQTHLHRSQEAGGTARMQWRCLDEKMFAFIFQLCH